MRSLLGCESALRGVKGQPLCRHRRRDGGTEGKYKGMRRFARRARHGAAAAARVDPGATVRTFVT